ncbi:type II toxin-antitoxin system RelE/ParE family toxin [Streptomyces sp. NPDC049040]|uniref:type II toxin-antitoxin system RelE/ParE family toxin n=1 Tax=Streptomyces sp. NPDC049040 TaxID=3365593 RepID=UPI003718216F
MLPSRPRCRRCPDSLAARSRARSPCFPRLLDAPPTLSEPYARHLGDGLRELRFSLGHDGNPVRLTYWLAPERRIVLLTVFRKSRMREDAEVDRAKQARKACEAERHSAHDEFSRHVTKGEGA